MKSLKSWISSISVLDNPLPQHQEKFQPLIHAEPRILVDETWLLTDAEFARNALHSTGRRRIPGIALRTHEKSSQGCAIVEPPELRNR
jgi:hypothetical protein